MVSRSAAKFLRRGVAACLLLVASSAVGQIDSSYQKFLFGIQFDHRLFVGASCRGHLTYEDMQAHGYEIPAETFVALQPQDSTWAKCRPPIDPMLAVMCGVPVRIRSVAVGDCWSSDGLFAPEPLQCLLAPIDSLPPCECSYFLILRDNAPFDRKIRRYELYNPPVAKQKTELQSLALSFAQKADILPGSNHDLTMEIYRPADSLGIGPLYAFVYRTVKTEFTWFDTEVMILKLWQSNVRWELDELRTWERVDGPMLLECTLDLDGDQWSELMVREVMGAAVFKEKLRSLEQVARVSWVAP
jgi:hypothetical protein